MDNLPSSTVCRSAVDWLAEVVADSSYEIGIGAYGAIGQFSGDRREGVVVERERIVAATATATIALRRDAPLRPVAFETLSSDPQGWNTGVALCMPEPEAWMSGRGVWTVLDSDSGAIGKSGRSMLSCDVGLGTPYADILVRPLSEESRRNAASTQDERVPLGAFQRNFPDDVWVFDTRLGRIETRCPQRRHLFSRLLKGKSLHANTVPVPAGYVSVGYVLPPNPLRAEGDEALARFSECQGLIDRFGIPKLSAWKRAVEKALEEDRLPAEIWPPPRHGESSTRHEMACLRVALRQRKWLRGESDRLRWVEAFDPSMLSFRSRPRSARSRAPLQRDAAFAFRSINQPRLER